MTTVFATRLDWSPLLISIPHDGRLLPANISDRMTAAGLALPDTDWHVTRLYDELPDLNASFIIADYSRYVVDLNRSSADEPLYDNQWGSGLCPEYTFAREPIYRDGFGPDSSDKAWRIEKYWQPYHQALASMLDDIRERCGYALLWDAHSIMAEVPSLFDGRLPDLNVGTNDGASCPEEVAEAVMSAAAGSSLTSILNGRFRGGYITRNYGSPDDRVLAIQLELAQRSYMDEQSMEYDAERAPLVAETIGTMLNAYVEAAREWFES